MKNYLIKFLAITGAMTWWAIFYPELSFIDGTYQLVWTENEKQIHWQDESVLDRMDASDAVTKENMTEVSESDIFSGLLQAGEEKIVIESKLLEWLFEK